MASSVKEIITAQYAPSAQTALYLSPTGTWTRIDKLSVTNSSGGAQTISINLIPNGGTATAANLTTNLRAVQPGETWNSPNEYGHVLNPGDSISVIASGASALVIAAAGTVLS
jgi:hypothetical protein